MKARCPQCGFTYDIDDSKIPEGGADVQCSECNHIFEIKLDKLISGYIIKVSDDSTYEASSEEEVKEWISENRLLKDYQISSDGKNWEVLGEVPKFKAIFDKMEESKHPRKEVIIQPKKENSADEMEKSFSGRSTQEILKEEFKYKKYDDSSVNSFQYMPTKKRGYLVWFILLLLVGGTVFVVLKPKLIKKWYKKITSSNSQTADDYYNSGIKIFKKYDIKSFDKAITFFDKALKNNPKHIHSLAYKNITYSFELILIKKDLDFYKWLKTKLELIEKNGDKIEFIISKKKVEKKITTLNLKKQQLNQLITELTPKIVALAKDNYFTYVSLTFMGYFNKDKTKFEENFGKLEKMKPKHTFTTLFKLLKDDIDQNLTLKSLKKATKKFKAYIPFRFFLGYQYVKDGEFTGALATFEAITVIEPKNDLAIEKISILESIIKNRKFFDKNYQAKKVEDDKKDQNSDNKKDDKENKDDKKVVKDDKGDENKKDENKTDDKKSTPKVVKKLSFEDLMRNGDSAFKRERKKSAYYSYKKALAIKPSARAASQMGWILLDWGNVDAAISYFHKSVSYDSSYVEAYIGLGESYIESEDKVSAKKYFQIYLKKSPNGPEASIARNRLKTLK